VPAASVGSTGHDPPGALPSAWSRNPESAHMIASVERWRGGRLFRPAGLSTPNTARAINYST